MRLSHSSGVGAGGVWIYMDAGEPCLMLTSTAAPYTSSVFNSSPSPYNGAFIPEDLDMDVHAFSMIVKGEKTI